jgi:predicted MFS family arabinose efflux permease
MQTLAPNSQGNILSDKLRIVETKDKSSLNIQLFALASARLILNTALRFVYPYAPALARGLGVPREEIYFLITLRNLTGFLSPVFGPLSERYGRRAVLMAGMTLFAAGAFLVVFWPTYWILGICLCTMGIAKVLYDPAMQAYVADVVPYERRGVAISITEYSWSLALLVGVPVVGLLIQRQGWQAPFLWLGIGGLVGVFFLWRTISPGKKNEFATTNFYKIIQLLREHKVVLYAALYITLFVTANEMLLIVFGSWMEDVFHLSLTSLGIAAAIIGGAELIGETFAGWSVDRYGKRPVIIFAGFFTAFCNFILPFTSESLAGALMTLFFLFLAFEITIVGGIPLMTELVPSSRAVVMSIILAAMFFGRSLGSFLGPLVWNIVGFTYAGIVWAAIAAVSVLILWGWVQEEES